MTNPLLEAFREETREIIRKELLNKAWAAMRQHSCSACGLSEAEQAETDAYNYIARRMYESLSDKRLSDKEWHELMLDAAKIRSDVNEDEWM